MPRIFLSYSHESAEHTSAVVALAAQLRLAGIDAILDQYVQAPDMGWPRWMQEQIEGADYVLVVCTAAYKRRFEGREEGGSARGANWEGYLTVQLIYDGAGINRRYVPVLLPGASAQDIPLPLRATTAYALPAEEEALYRRLTGQPKYTIVPVGAVRESVPADASAPNVRLSGTSGPLQRAGLGYQMRWHVERREEEEWALESLVNSGDPVAVCAPMHFGKSWFIERVLSVAQQRAPDECIARVNFDVVESSELEPLLQSIAEQIGSSVELDITWPRRGTPQGRLLEVLDSQIRPKVPRTMILALDLPHDLVRLRERDALSRTMRALSGQGDRQRFPWLRVIVALSTAPALLGDSMGSPWSVPEIQLEAFGDAQILDLAGHHGLAWGAQELTFLRDTIGGHPYMLRGAMYEAARLGVPLARAIDNDAVRSHIRRLEGMLVQDKDLLEALGAVVDGRAVTASYAHRLEAAGIISFKRSSLRYELRFPIYQRIAERLTWR